MSGYDIFIIHASPDKPSARRLRAALVAHGLSVFLDEVEVKSGQPWDESIDSALRGSLLQVVLLGKSDHWYQRDEIGIAIQEMREQGAQDRIIPILLTARAKVPYGLSRIHAIRWDGPAAVAAQIATKAYTLRGAITADGGTQRRIRIAVIGLWDEMPSTFETLCRRVNQHSAILDGDVRRVDLAHDDIPEVELRVVLLGSRHGDKLDLLASLAADARRGPSSRTVIGALAIELGKVPKPFRAEALVLQDVHDEISNKGDATSVIDALDEQITSWFATRFQSQPGQPTTLERWEERYLRDKTLLWRRGDPGAMRLHAREPADRVHWYVHLKSELTRIDDNANAFQVDRELKIHAQREYRASAAPNPRTSNGPDWAKAFNFAESAPETAITRPWLDRVLSLRSLPRCVVVGLAGTGKTVLLQHLAWVLSAKESAGSQSGPIHRVSQFAIRGQSPIPPIPVLHTASTVAVHLRRDRPIHEALVELLRSSDTFGDSADSAKLRSGIDIGRYVFLIDSLDEVPSQEDRRALVEALGTLSGTTPRVILTTRPSSHTAVDLPRGFARVDIAPLDQEDSERLTRAWLACWAPDEAPTQVMLAVDSVRRNFPTETDERSPVESPLLLTCILQVYATYRRLPDDTAKLYSDMVRLLCEARIRTSDDNRDTLVERYREALREIFLVSQERGGTHLSVVDACEILTERRLVARTSAENWLNVLANQTGLMRFEGIGDHAVLRPWHRSYQEYLAAEAIALRYANRADECVTWLRSERQNLPKRIHDPSWRGTLRFLVGAASHQHRSGGVRLVESLVDAAKITDSDQARLFALAAEGAAEYSKNLFQNEALCETLPLSLVEYFERNGIAWPVDERLDALDALGRLGDPRLANPCHYSDESKGWIQVESGTYPVGATAVIVGERRENKFGVAQRHVSDFWVRRWPTTVAEFLPFVKDTASEDFWRIEFGGQRGTGLRPRLPADTIDPLEYYRTQSRYPTRPVVDVSQFIAERFCAWAQTHWHLPIQGTVALPTVVEWEIAARRRTSRVYPWGNLAPNARDSAKAAYAWNADRFREGATPVGAFPLGHTPEGIWDMGGNVDEWCEHDDGVLTNLHTGFEPAAPPFAMLHIPHSGGIRRGGSWAADATKLRTIHQDSGQSRSNRDSATGFRIVCRTIVYEVPRDPAPIGYVH